MPKVVIMTKKFAEISRDPIKALEQAGITVEERDFDRASPEREAEYTRAIAGADAIIVTAMFPANRKLITAADSLQMIAIRSAGFEGSDLKAATEKGVVVTHNPGSNASSVADMAIGLMLAVSKQIARKDREMRKGLYNRGGGDDLFRKSVGIIGLGNIGKRVAMRLQGFEVNILANDIVDYPEFRARYSIPLLSKEEVLEKSDFVTIHVPLDDSTRAMIGEERLKRMKPTAYLVNTARGEIVDEQALYKALTEGWIAGAGLDVFHEEPPKFRALVELENVVCTPHSAGLSREASYAMAMETAHKVLAFFQGKVPDNVLNPEVLPKLNLAR
ncbi:MAG TPA: phosphoglycerate dehydrogenase [Thermodesulfobacteriota bacterium]|nr:phosphoglycerate dehydrogenase [Thermodesulfobacteriota bacterium]